MPVVARAPARSPVLTIARYTLVEAHRGGLPWLALIGAAAALAIAAFASQVAITESLQLQAAVCAALLRTGAVFLVATHVVTSVAREHADKAFELALSLPVTRTAYFLGKFAGHATAAAALAGFFAVPLLLWAPAGAVGAWWISLALEATLAAALGLFFAFTLANVVPALSAVAGLYVLGRTIGPMQAIAANPLADSGPLATIAHHGLDLLALVMPRLDVATRTDWVVYASAPPGEVVAALASLALYAALAVAAGLVDFHRRNL